MKPLTDLGELGRITGMFLVIILRPNSKQSWDPKLVFRKIPLFSNLNHDIAKPIERKYTCQRQQQ